MAELRHVLRHDREAKAHVYVFLSAETFLAAHRTAVRQSKTIATLATSHGFGWGNSDKTKSTKIIHTYRLRGLVMSFTRTIGAMRLTREGHEGT
jgi:hypothetical protein